MFNDEYAFADRRCWTCGHKFAYGLYSRSQIEFDRGEECCPPRKAFLEVEVWLAEVANETIAAE